MLMPIERNQLVSTKLNMCNGCSKFDKQIQYSSLYLRPIYTIIKKAARNVLLFSILVEYDFPIQQLIVWLHSPVYHRLF